MESDGTWISLCKKVLSRWFGLHPIIRYFERSDTIKINPWFNSFLDLHRIETAPDPKHVGKSEIYSDFYLQQCKFTLFFYFSSVS